MEKQDPKISYKQAIIEARKTYKKQAAQPVPEIEKEWNVSSSNYSTVGKKKGSLMEKGNSRRRRSRRRGGYGKCSNDGPPRSRRHVGGDNCKGESQPSS